MLPGQFDILCFKINYLTLIYNTWQPNLSNHTRLKNSFFFYQGFLSRTLMTHRTEGEERGPFFIPLYHFHPLTNIQTFICNFAREIFLIATLVFTRLLLDEIFPPYRITIWLIADVKFVLVCLLDDLILGFCYSNLDTGNRWTQTRIDYHPCITSEATNQVC